MENGFLTFLLIFAIILQIFIVIYFFRATKDIYLIRKAITVNRNKLDEYDKQKAFGNNVEAKQALEAYIWERLTHNGKHFLEPDRARNNESLRSLLESKLNDVGGTWPILN